MYIYIYIYNIYIHLEYRELPPTFISLQTVKILKSPKTCLRN